MKIVIATDHNGVNEKRQIINYLKNKYEILDLSPNNTSDDDYPLYAFNVGKYITNNDNCLGILLCGTGIGMSIAANKVKGIRCAHVSKLSEAKLARMHNNANIIAMSYKNELNDLLECIEAFITTSFAQEERHIRRVNEINNYEKEN